MSKYKHASGHHTHTSIFLLGSFSSVGWIFKNQEYNMLTPATQGLCNRDTQNQWMATDSFENLISNLTVLGIINIQFQKVPMKIFIKHVELSSYKIL